MQALSYWTTIVFNTIQLTYTLADWWLTGPFTIPTHRVWNSIESVASITVECDLASGGIAVLDWSVSSIVGAVGWITWQVVIACSNGYMDGSSYNHKNDRRRGCHSEFPTLLLCGLSLQSCYRLASVWCKSASQLIFIGNKKGRVLAFVTNMALHWSLQQ